MKGMANKILEAGKTFQQLGLEYNPFRDEPLTENEIHLLAGRQSELNEMIQIIGERRNILITGVKGIGKTTVLHYLKGQAKKENIIVAWLDAPSLSERQFFLNVLLSIFEQNNKIDENCDSYKEKIYKYEKSPAQYPTRKIINDITFITEKYKRADYPLLVFVDEFHRLMLSSNYSSYGLIVNLCNTMFNKKFVFVCASLISTAEREYDNPSKGALMDRFTAVLSLKPFELNDTIQLINKRIESVKISNFSIPNATIAAIYEHSEGTPREIISICDSLLRQALHNKELTPNIVKKTVTSLGLDPAQKLTTQLKQNAQRIYKKILEIKKPTSPTELGMLLELPTSTICYNLKTLQAEGLVKRIGSGSHTKYCLDEAIKSTIQTNVKTVEGNPIFVSGQEMPPSDNRVIIVNPKNPKIYNKATIVSEGEPVNSSHATQSLNDIQTITQETLTKKEEKDTMSNKEKEDDDRS